jgi:hypothetical protein
MFAPIPLVGAHRSSVLAPPSAPRVLLPLLLLHRHRVEQRLYADRLSLLLLMRW